MLERFLGLLRDDLAVDLGTANTHVGVAGEGLVVSEPSVVAVSRGGNRVLAQGCAVGHLARQMQGRTPDSISVVRPLRAGVVADFELCEAMLRHFLRKAQAHGWRLRPRIVVAVPGDVTPVERRALYNSLERAGAGDIFAVPAAQAAALGAGLPVAEPVANMVVDVGSGSTEVAVMSLSEVVACQSIRVAGDVFDECIVRYLRRQHGLKIGSAAAERLKIDIGSAFPLDRELADEASGVDAASGLPRRITVTSEEVREALDEPLLSIVEAIKTTIDGCSPELASDLVDRGLVLSGGGACLRHLDRYLAEMTGIPVRMAAEPQSAVARGALVCSENFSTWRPLMESSHGHA